jgi:N-acetylneuraminic acid mutarotase
MPAGASFSRLTVLVCVLSMAFAVPARVAAQTAAGTALPNVAEAWTTLAPLPEPLADIQGASANGKFYVFGGLEGVRAKGVVLEFDPATGVWAKKKPMPVLAHHIALAAYGDRFYLFGGFKYPEKGGGWQPLDNAWEYDPAGDSWKALKAMPSKRGGAAATALDGKFYVIGGAAPAKGSTPETLDPKRRHEVLALVEEYDLKTDSWRVRAPLSTPRALPVAATITGKIYLIGGRIASLFPDGSDIDLVEMYDPAADSWSLPLAKMPVPRAASGFGLWRNSIVVIGSDTKGAAAGNVIELYDPSKNLWKAMPPVPQPRRGFAAGTVGDRLYLAGGDNAEAGQKPGLTLLQALQLDAVK